MTCAVLEQVSSYRKDSPPLRCEMPPGAASVHASLNATPEFLNGMRRMANSVSVVAASLEGTWRGLTATAVCSLSAEPPMLAVCVNKSCSAYATIAASTHFSVNCLASDQQCIAEAFAGRVPLAERFRYGQWHQDAFGAPVLDGAIASFACELEQVVDVATHTLFIGLVLSARQGPTAAPLVYQDRAYRTFN